MGYTGMRLCVKIPHLHAAVPAYYTLFFFCDNKQIIASRCARSLQNAGNFPFAGVFVGHIPSGLYELGDGVITPKYKITSLLFSCCCSGKAHYLYASITVCL